MNGYLRVTQTLNPFSGLDSVDDQTLANACRRGTKVHRICECIVRGLGDFGNDEEAQPFVESFEHWWQTNPNVIEIEKRYFCKTYMITGQIDYICKDDDGYYIVDIKTSYSPSKTWKPQGSAYAYLCRIHGYDIKKIQFLHLKRNGKPPKIIEYEPDEDLYFSIYKTFKYFYGAA